MWRWLMFQAAKRARPWFVAHQRRQGPDEEDHGRRLGAQAGGAVAHRRDQASFPRARRSGVSPTRNDKKRRTRRQSDADVCKPSKVGRMPCRAMAAIRTIKLVLPPWLPPQRKGRGGLALAPCERRRIRASAARRLKQRGAALGSVLRNRFGPTWHRAGSRELSSAPRPSASYASARGADAWAWPEPCSPSTPPR